MLRSLLSRENYRIAYPKTVQNPSEQRRVTFACAGLLLVIDNIARHVSRSRFNCLANVLQQKPIPSIGPCLVVYDSPS